ncbi:MAG: hypothetical protein ACE5D7_04465 [Fidelibacterota bacterium]
MDLKDKLNLLWKYLFLALIAYGVFSITCGIKDCKSRCDKSSYTVGCDKGGHYGKAGCDKPCPHDKKNADKKACPPDCNKPCCAHKKKSEPSNK